MNLFQLILKQMRQRALSTWLTLLSVVIGVALAVAVLILQRESGKLFGQSDFGYDIIIGPPKGAPLTLTLNTVYHLDASPGNLPYSLYEDMTRKGDVPPGRASYDRYVRQAVPFMVGDSYNGHRLVGTSPQMFGFDDSGKPVTSDPFEYRKGKKYELAQGRVFHPKRFEAVIGSEVAEKQRMGLGSKFRATHGFPGPNEKPDIHKPEWTVVGILQPTHTANDRVLFLPIISLYAIEEHEDGMLIQACMKAGIDPSKIPPDKLDETLRKLGFDPAKVPASALKALKLKSAAKPGEELIKDVGAKKEEVDEDAYKLDEDGNIVPDLPKEEWELSAILVRTRAPIYHETLTYLFKTVNNEATAVAPAIVMRQFFDTFLADSTLVLLVISWLVTIVAGVSILVSIYNSVSARMREIAILRALGATRVRILSLICLEAALIGLVGSVLGLLIGHLMGAVESYFFNKRLGQSIEWYRVSEPEIYTVLLAVVIAALAGLVPGMKAYASPVAVNLTSG
jgi:putative ABC transport system permease protein